MLRGPQGTLFGRSTIGGAISLVSKRPSSDFDGYAEAGVGNYGRKDLTAVLNLPIGDGGHAMRPTAAHSEHTGYSRSTVEDHYLDDEDSNFMPFLEIELTRL